MDAGKLYLDTELANVLAIVMPNFASELDIAKWDFVRIALSSWTLTVSKNHQNFRSNNVCFSYLLRFSSSVSNSICRFQISIFIAAIFRLFSAVSKFFEEEKIRSSTELLTNVIEEWDNVFAKDVNLVLLKTYINIVKDIGMMNAYTDTNRLFLLFTIFFSDRTRKSDEYFLDTISPHVDSIDFNYVLKVWRFT